MHIDPAFESAIDYLDLASIASSPDVIYIVDATLHLRAFNDAWLAFARENDGGDIPGRYALGACIAEVFPRELRAFLTTGYQRALTENRPFEHDYECSSPDQFRLYRQNAYPLVRSTGLVIANHLVALRPHELTPHEFSMCFVDPRGVVTQCCNCRKLRDPANAAAWLWVPDALRGVHPRTSHAICPRCYDFYYPEIDEP